MADLLGIMLKNSSSQISTMESLVATAGGSVTLTVNGLEMRQSKYGESPVFRGFNSNGEIVRFWGAGKSIKEQMIPELLKEYGTVEAIDAALRVQPILMTIHPVITLKNGNRFRPVEVLGYAEDVS